ncbi:MAG: NTP transferase domain-containing protein [Saprospiraceae bacterium]|nr:NTP transferase domain-containing protein [Saprospiraceae bacterium]
MISEYRNFSVIILAAGKSERMGVPKLGLKFDENMLFAEKILESILEIEPMECVIVVNHQGLELVNSGKVRISDKVKIVLNDDPDKGRFYSLQCGLKSLNSRGNILITNIDNPFINKDICLKMLRQINDCDYIYPVFNGKGGHPLLINKTVAEGILLQDNTQMNLKEFLISYRKKTNNVSDQKVLININTPEDYINIFQPCS